MEQNRTQSPTPKEKELQLLIADLRREVLWNAGMLQILRQNVIPNVRDTIIRGLVGDENRQPGGFGPLL
jgi:hypothetical protein